MLTIAGGLAFLVLFIVFIIRKAISVPRRGNRAYKRAVKRQQAQGGDISHLLYYDAMTIDGGDSGGSSGADCGDSGASSCGGGSCGGGDC